MLARCQLSLGYDTSMGKRIDMSKLSSCELVVASFGIGKTESNCWGPKSPPFIRSSTLVQARWHLQFHKRSWCLQSFLKLYQKWQFLQAVQEQNCLALCEQSYGIFRGFATAPTTTEDSDTIATDLEQATGLERWSCSYLTTSCLCKYSI